MPSSSVKKTLYYRKNQSASHSSSSSPSPVQQYSPHSNSVSSHPPHPLAHSHYSNTPTTTSITPPAVKLTMAAVLDESDDPTNNTSSFSSATTSKSMSRNSSHTPKQLRRLVKELKPQFTTGNFCKHSNHLCMISFLPQHMAIQITPHYFPSGRFGPMILDSQLDHLHPPLLGSKSEEEYIGYKSNNSKPKSHKSTRSTVSDRNNQKLVVRKMVNLLEIEDDLLEQLKHEVLTLRKLCHPNILPIYSAEIEGSNLFIAMPFAERGCCRFILEKHFEYGFKEKLVRHILTSVLSAVFYLHVNSIIHTRICSRNVLLSLQGHVYLTGFEYAQSVAQTAGMLFDLPKDIIDYLPWTAPEVLAQDTRGFSFPADIYSVGALGVELNNGVPPFTDPTNPLAPSLIMLEKLKGFTPRLLDSSTINEDTLTVLEEGQMTDESAQMDMLVFKQRTLSQDYHQLVNTCCRTSPWTRPTAEQLLKSCPFTNPIEQKRMSGSGELESELPIIDLPVDEKTTEEGEGEVSGGNNKSTTSVITTGGGTQLGTFETIEEENESQLSSHLPPEDGLSSLNALSAATPQGLWGSFWNF